MKINEKGITLVALIMTIVVLLILSVVAITAISDTELVAKTNSAVNQWQQAEKDEGTTLNSYLDYINIYGGGCSHSWKWGSEQSNYYVGNYTVSSMVCEKCGVVCKHDECTTTEDPTEYYCYYWRVVCGFCNQIVNDSGPTSHQFNSSTGICSSCNYQCKHSSLDLNGTCKICNYNTLTGGCSHSWEYNGSWAQGICKSCGLLCDHPSKEWIDKKDDYFCSYEQEICDSCGLMTNDSSPTYHNYNSNTGICSSCNYQCKHSKTNSSGVCDYCKKTVQ